jgi:hypothetical protein
VSHPLVAPCWACGSLTGSPQLDLDRRVEWLEPADLTSGTPKTMHIVSSERLMAFCCHACWLASQAALAASFELTTTYPHGQVAPCSRCSQPISRTSPHLCLALTEMSYSAAEPGIARCIDDHTWAILCHPACSAPRHESAVEAVVAEL